MQIQELSHLVSHNPELEASLRENPQQALKTIGSMPLQSDVWIYRVVVLALGAVVLLTVMISGTLAFYGKVIPEGIIAVGSTAVGAMAGLLAPSPNR